MLSPLLLSIHRKHLHLHRIHLINRHILVLSVLEHQIDPFLMHKASYKRKQWPTGQREAELSPHLVCVLRSAFPVACVKGSAER